MPPRSRSSASDLENRSSRVELWDWVLSRLGGRSDSQSVWPPNESLPEFGDPVPVGSVVGTTSGELGLPAGIALVPGSHDAHMTAWGGGIDSPGIGFDPGGRTGGLGVAVGAGMHVGLAEYGMPSPVSGVHIVGGPVAAHGAMLDWWARLVRAPLGELLLEAESVPPGSEGVTALPFLDGERAPRWNPELRAEIVGLHVSHDRRDHPCAARGDRIWPRTYRPSAAQPGRHHRSRGVFRRTVTESSVVPHQGGGARGSARRP